jgi:hypothetical protein
MEAGINTIAKGITKIRLMIPAIIIPVANSAFLRHKFELFFYLK